MRVSFDWYSPATGMQVGVDLCVAGVGEEGAFLVGAPGGGDVAALGVGGEIEDVPVAARGEDDGIAGVGGDFAGDHVADDDAPGVAIDDDDIEHLRAREHLDGALRDLFGKGAVSAEEQLLAGLAARVKGAGDLGAAEGAIRQQTAVLAGEGDAGGDALVDDGVADLGEAVDVCFARAEVAALDRVVEEPEYAVAVVLVVLGGVDAALGGDGVGPSRGILIAEALYPVAEVPQRGRRRGAREGRSRR